jgi:hypothetical protein
VTTTTLFSDLFSPYDPDNPVVIVDDVISSVLDVIDSVTVDSIVVDNRPQDKDVYSDVPNWVKLFKNNRPTLYRGSWTSYQPKSFPILENLTYVQSESNGRDESMFNYRV